MSKLISSAPVDTSIQGAVGSQSYVPYYDPATEAPEFINPMLVVEVLWRRRLAIIIVTAVITILGTLAFKQVRPVYEAQATLLLEKASNVVDIEAVVSGLQSNAEAIQTQTEIIKSRAILGRVADTLKLADNPDFNPNLKEGKGLAALLPFLSKKEDKEDDVASTEAKLETDRNYVIENLKSAVSVSNIRDSMVIVISVSAYDPVIAKQIANQTAETYLTYKLESRFETTQRASRWLSERLETLRAAVNASEAAVEEYRKANGILQGKESSLAVQELTDTNTALIAARAELESRQARLTQAQSIVRGGGDTNSITEVLSSPIIQSLRQTLAETEQNKAELATKYGAKHPTLINIQAEIQDLRRNIQGEVQKIISSLQNEVSVAQTKLDNLSGRFTGIQAEASRLGEREIQLRALEREADANRALFETFLSRFKETSNQEDLTDSEATLLSSATLAEEPVFPKMTQIFILCFLIGSFLGFLTALFQEYLDQGLRSVEEVEKIIGVTALGVLPDLASLGHPDVTPEDYVLEKPISAFSESLRNIRTSLMLSDVDNPPKVIVITSSRPSEGKTTFSLCLSRLIARSGQKVLLVDCDLRRPTIHTRLKQKRTPGLIEILSGQVSFQDALQKDTASDMRFITAGAEVTNPADLIGSRMFKDMIAEQRNNYDFVILDTPPILAVADTKLIVRVSDKVLYLCHWAETHRKTLRSGLRQLKEAHGDLAGILLTRVDVRAQERLPNEIPYYSKSYSSYYDKEN